MLQVDRTNAIDSFSIVCYTYFFSRLCLEYVIPFFVNKFYVCLCICILWYSVQAYGLGCRKIRRISNRRDEKRQKKEMWMLVCWQSVYFNSHTTCTHFLSEIHKSNRTNMHQISPVTSFYIAAEQITEILLEKKKEEFFPFAVYHNPNFRIFFCLLCNLNKQTKFFFITCVLYGFLVFTLVYK